MKERTLGIFQLILAGFVVALFPFLVRLVDNMNIVGISFFRIFIAMLLISLFFVFFRKRLAPLNNDIPKMILFGILHALIILGYYFAINRLTIANAVLLLYTFPIWMVVFSFFILKEKIRVNEIVALILSISGIVILISPNGFFISESVVGSLSGLLAGVGAGLVYVLSKSFKNYDKVSLIFWQNLIAVPFISILLIFDFPDFSIVTSFEWGILLLMGLASLTAFILLFKGLAKVKSSIGGNLMLLEILWPIVLASFVFAEFPTTSTIIGGLLIIFGAALSLNRK
jgi:drug/metabolite transporter (DMT)-like permease